MAKNKGFDLNSIRGSINISDAERKEREYLRKEEYRLGIHMGYDSNIEDNTPYSSVYKNKQEWLNDCRIVHECIENKKSIPKDVEERLLITRREHYGDN